MGKYDGILLCSDLDGTIVDSKGAISKENIDAIKYFMDNGGRFSLCTGRSPQYAKSLEERDIKCNAPIVALNGAMIYDLKNDKKLYENPIDLERIKGIDGFVKENEKHFDAVHFHSKQDVESYDKIEDEILYKVVFCCKSRKDAKELRRKLEKKYTDSFCIINSWDVGIEILDEKSTKGESILKMKKLLGVDKIVCVGDYENDISMLMNADISYAVANAIPEAKRAATKITVSNDENALAVIISEL